MPNELRDKLLGLFPDDQDFVEAFLQDVDSTNSEALERIARAISVETTDETPGEAVEEDEDEEEVEEEETVEDEEEVEDVAEEAEEEENEEEAETDEEEDFDVVLDENFVTDLVDSEEFRTALGSVVNDFMANFRAEVDERFRSITEQVEEQQEWVEDVPARRRRAVVSYRATNTVQHNEEQQNNTNEEENFADVARNSVSEIFD